MLSPVTLSSRVDGDIFLIFYFKKNSRVRIDVGKTHEHKFFRLRSNTKTINKVLFSNSVNTDCKHGRSASWDHTKETQHCIFLLEELNVCRKGHLASWA